MDEMAGRDFLYHQSYFNELQRMTGAQLENVTYFREGVHYFVMTAVRENLLEQGVFKQVSSSQSAISIMS